jgi:hypothetical protein
MNSAAMLRLGVQLSSLRQAVVYDTADLTEDGFFGSTTGQDLQNMSPA